MILFELGDFWVRKSKLGFEVFKSGITHSIRVSTIGFKGQIGLDKAISEAKRRYSLEQSLRSNLNNQHPAKIPTK